MATKPGGRLLVIAWNAVLINLLVAAASEEFRAFWFRSRRRRMARPPVELRREQNRSVEFNYDLTGNVSGLCPECGKKA